MQLQKAERENNNAQSSRFSEKIGSTIFTVNIHHSTPKSESLEDKILRMMKNDLKIDSQSAIIRMPQVDWLPERGSV